MAETFLTASITVNNLSKHFGPNKAVDDVTLKVESGTMVCLLGPSGCGKTTTLRMIAGFEEPTAGVISSGRTTSPKYHRMRARQQWSSKVMRCSLI